MSCNEFYKQIKQIRHTQSSWCATCAKRNICKVKEEVAIEERIATGTRYLNIFAECAMYQKDEHLIQKPRNIMDWWGEYMDSRQMGV